MCQNMTMDGVNPIYSLKITKKGKKYKGCHGQTNPKPKTHEISNGKPLQPRQYQPNGKNDKTSGNTMLKTG